MAKTHAKFTTLTETMHLTCDSVLKSEIVKAPNGMLYKLFCDVRNGANYWNIYVWSNVLSQWNQLASKDIIPDIQHLSYFNCYASGSTCRPNPIILSNWDAMKKFIDIFSSNLPNSVDDLPNSVE